MSTQEQKPFKYYEPEIEDLRIGDEVHIKDCGNYSNCEGCDFSATVSGIMSYPNIWVISKNTQQEYELYPQQIRVAYLTKEQIEAEGWEAAREHPTAHFKKDINKDSYFSLTLNADNQIVITKSFIDGWAWKWSPFYSGECRDINTFRYLCKLLNIN